LKDKSTNLNGWRIEVEVKVCIENKSGHLISYFSFSKK